MASPERVQLLSEILGPKPHRDAVIFVATNHPPAQGEGAGTWTQYRFSTVELAAQSLDKATQNAETYFAAAWFGHDGGRRKADVIAKRTICADVDDKAMPGATSEERHRQSRSLAGSIPAPSLLVDSGGGCHPHLLLPPGGRLEDFDEPEDGRRHVEILGIALRLYLEERAQEILGVRVTLDVTDGVERLWRCPPSFNMKAGDGAKALTSDRSRWREVRLLHAAGGAALASVVPADLSFLQAFLGHAEGIWETREGRKGGGVATLDRGEPKKQGSAGPSVAVATSDSPYFDPSVLSEDVRRRWPMHEGDQSGHDWAVAHSLAELGWSPATAAAAIRVRRRLLRDAADRAKGERLDYVEATVLRAYEDVLRQRAVAEVLPYEPFPFQVLPEPIERFVLQSAQAMRCSPEAILATLLPSLGVAIGNSRRLQVKSTWSVPPLLWMCLVMPSGLLKTPAQEQGLLVFQRRHGESIRDWKAAMASYKVELQRHELRVAQWKQQKNPEIAPPEAPVRPVPRRLIVQDTTIEALVPLLEQNLRGLLLYRDELSGWFKSHGAYKQGRGGDLEHWLSVFNASSLTVDRKGDEAVHYVQHAFVGICGGIQPGALRRTLTREMFDNGAAARLLFLMPDAPLRVWSEDEVSPTVLRALERVVSRLLSLDLETYSDGSRQPIVMTFDGEARAAWAPYFNALGVRMREVGQDEDVGAALSKLEGYVPRLALIFALTSWAAGPSEDAPAHVDAGSLQSAIEACTWFEREARRVYAMLDEGPEAGRRRKLVGWIRAQGGRVTPRDVQRGLRGYRGQAQEAERALQDLVDHGFGWWVIMPPPPAGGHAGRAFELRSDDDTSGDGDTRSDRGPFVAGLEERVSPGGAPQTSAQATGPLPGAPPARGMSPEDVVVAVEGVVLAWGPAVGTEDESPQEFSCHACHGRDFWSSPWRERICRTCHPGAPGAEVLPGPPPGPRAAPRQGALSHRPNQAKRRSR